MTEKPPVYWSQNPTSPKLLFWKPMGQRREKKMEGLGIIAIAVLLLLIVIAIRGQRS